MPNSSHSTKTMLLGCLAVIAVGWGLSFGKHTVSYFLFSGVIAYLLLPAVRTLEKYRIPPLAAVSMVFAWLFMFSWLAFGFGTALLLSKLNTFTNALPGYIAKAKEMADAMQQHLVSLGLPKESVASLSGIQIPADFGLHVATKANAVGSGLFHLVIIPIVLFLILYYRTEIKDSVMGTVPSVYREKVAQIGREIDRAMRQFLYGQVVIVGVVVVLTYPALLAIGIKYALFCSLVAGVFTLIPYLGTFVSILLPIFFAYAEGLGTSAALQVVGAYALIHLVEGYIIKPFIYKRGAINLHPLLTIFAVLFLGEVAGLWGIVLAIPLAAILKILWRNLYNTTETAPAETWLDSKRARGTPKKTAQRPSPKFSGLRRKRIHQKTW